jgi:hypothetical protein
VKKNRGRIGEVCSDGLPRVSLYWTLKSKRESDGIQLKYEVMNDVAGCQKWNVRITPGLSPSVEQRAMKRTRDYPQYWNRSRLFVDTYSFNVKQIQRHSLVGP